MERTIVTRSEMVYESPKKLAKRGWTFGAIFSEPAWEKENWYAMHKDQPFSYLGPLAKGEEAGGYWADVLGENPEGELERYQAEFPWNEYRSFGIWRYVGTYRQLKETKLVGHIREGVLNV